MSNRKFLMGADLDLENPYYPVVGFGHEIEYRRSDVPFGMPIPYRSTYTINVAEPAEKEKLNQAIMRLFVIESSKAPKAKQVYLNDPYTIVIWDDGTKTLIKAQNGDEYDDKVGLLLCGVIKASNNRVRAVDFEDAIRTVAKLKEPQMRVISAVLEAMADNRISVEDMEDAIRVAANLDETQMRALSAALEVTADNNGKEGE